MEHAALVFTLENLVCSEEAEVHQKRQYLSYQSTWHYNPEDVSLNSRESHPHAIRIYSRVDVCQCYLQRHTFYTFPIDLIFYTVSLILDAYKTRSLCNCDYGVTVTNISFSKKMKEPRRRHVCFLLLEDVTSTFSTVGGRRHRNQLDLAGNTSTVWGT